MSVYKESKGILFILAFYHTFSHYYELEIPHLNIIFIFIILKIDTNILPT